MAYEFNRLADVEALTEVPENANALVEVNGAIKRVPGAGLGGGGIKTAIIKASDYDDALAGTWDDSGEVTYECTNMTFDEAYQTLANGEPLNVVLMAYGLEATIIPCEVRHSDQGIMFYELRNFVCYEWGPDGISEMLSPA